VCVCVCVRERECVSMRVCVCRRVPLRIGQRYASRARRAWAHVGGAAKKTLDCFLLHYDRCTQHTGYPGAAGGGGERRGGSGDGEEPSGGLSLVVDITAAAAAVRHAQATEHWLLNGLRHELYRPHTHTYTHTHTRASAGENEKQRKCRTAKRPPSSIRAWVH
jgi:hypothetical protein